MVSRVFYEAARDLDSPPSSRTDRVEACRPRGCLPVQSSRAAAREGAARWRAGRKIDAAPGRFEDPPPDPRAWLRGWRGLTPRWPRSLRLGCASRFNLARGPEQRKAVFSDSPHLA